MLDRTALLDRIEHTTEQAGKTLVTGGELPILAKR